jgi:hypothetical protein
VAEPLVRPAEKAAPQVGAAALASREAANLINTAAFAPTEIFRSTVVPAEDK